METSEKIILPKEYIENIYRWEFLRRSYQYEKDYNLYKQKEKKIKKQHEVDRLKEDFACKYQLDKKFIPQPSLPLLDENYNINYELFPRSKIGNVPLIRYGFFESRDKGVYCLPKELYFGKYNVSRLEESYNEIYVVDIRKPKKALLRELAELIKGAQELWNKEVIIQYGNQQIVRKKRPLEKIKKTNFDLLKKYLQVYDLKHRDKMTNKKIIKLLFPNNDPISADQNVDDYYRKAKKLIDNAVKNDFPGKYY